MLKFGRISSIDAATGLFKVTFDDDKLVSGWLHGAVPNSKDNKDELPFAQDEHVACMMSPDLGYGIVLCAVYDKKNAPAIGDPAVRGTTYKKEGTFSKVNTDTGEAEIALEKLTLNGGDNGGLIKIEAMLSAINTRFSSLKTACGAAFTALAGLDSGASNTAFNSGGAAQVIDIEKSSVEDTKILH